MILTAISLWEATFTEHWIGRIKVLDRFCVWKTDKALCKTTTLKTGVKL